MIQLLQKKIEKLYGLYSHPEADQYLINNDQLELFHHQDADIPKVLCIEEETDMSMAIYLGQKIFTNIHKPIKIFSFEDFCVMAEEISHYVYLVWSKCNNKQISLLDLEIQGEVDKYLLACEIYRTDKDLFEKIFKNFSFQKDLSTEERERYEQANRLSMKLVQSIEKKKVSKQKKTTWLRAFYRHSFSHRISMIESGIQ